MIDEEILRNAQYRKSLAISFFSATNAAIELAKAEPLMPPVDMKEFIVTWRDWLLEEHKKYYAQNIANTGVNYNVSETTEKLKSSKTLAELKSKWISLSQDERQDDQIKAEAQTLKKQLA